MDVRIQSCTIGLFPKLLSFTEHRPGICNGKFLAKINWLFAFQTKKNKMDVTFY